MRRNKSEVTHIVAPVLSPACSPSHWSPLKLLCVAPSNRVQAASSQQSALSFIVSSTQGLHCCILVDPIYSMKFKITITVRLVAVVLFLFAKFSSTDGFRPINTSKMNGFRPLLRSNLNMISHGMGFNKLNKPADQRKALLRALTTEVIRYGRIRTSLVRAKALRKPVDHMITLAKKGTLHHRRQALAYIYDKNLVHSLFDQAPERYGTRNGGYCRVLREEGVRRGDHAKMAIVELV